jgi:hypothetical protein
VTAPPAFLRQPPAPKRSDLPSPTCRYYFTADPTSDKPPYSIVIPPPNVTGNLHLGTRSSTR